MNWLMKRMLKSKRAVSPVVAVVLLIGVVVVGIVAVFVLFNLLTTPTTVLEVTAVREVDRNGDGLIDKFEIDLINSGTGSASVSDVTVTFVNPVDITGFKLTSTTSTVTSTGTTISFETSDVNQQLDKALRGGYEIKVAYQGTDIITFDQNSELIKQKVVDPQNPQSFVTDNADGNWAGSSNGGSVNIVTTDTNAQHSGQTGVRFRLDNNNYYYWRIDSSVSVNTTNGNYPQTNDLTKSPETIDFSDKNVLVFWIRFSTNNIGNTLDAWVYFRTYSGSTVQATRTYQFISNGNFVSGKAFSAATVGNDWVRIVVDLSDLSSYNPTSDGNTLAFFGLRFQQASSTYYAYIDDIGVYNGL